MNKIVPIISMKILFLYFVGIMISTQVYCQTPAFVFSLKAKKALGFKDSVIIGTYGENINNSGLVP